MTCEQKLILASARSRPTEKDLANIHALLSQAPDWGLFLKLAERHRLMPLAHRNLARCSTYVPEAVLEQMRTSSERTALRALLLTGELTRLVLLCDREKIPILPYKGPCLAMTVYGEIITREFSDLDLFIQSSDFYRVKDLLLASGYEPLIDIPAAREALYLRSNYEYNFVHRASGARVEVHWNVGPRYMGMHFDPCWLWADSAITNINDVLMLSVPLEKLILILCVHGTKHAWERLSWVCDVAEIARNYPKINWEQVANDAGRMRMTRPLLLGLCLCKDLFEVTLPDWIVGLIQGDTAIEDLSKRCVRNIWTGADAPGTDIQRWQFLMKLQKGFVQKTRALAGYFLTPDFSTWRLSQFSFFAYPAVRILRVSSHMKQLIGGKATAL